MTADTVTIPVSAIIFLGSTVITLLGGLFSMCGHLLISIRQSLGTLITKMAVRDAEVEARLVVMERHDANNEDDKRWAQRNGLAQDGGGR